MCRNLPRTRRAHHTAEIPSARRSLNRFAASSREKQKPSAPERKGRNIPRYHLSWFSESLTRTRRGQLTELPDRDSPAAYPSTLSYGLWLSLPDLTFTIPAQKRHSGGSVPRPPLSRRAVLSAGETIVLLFFYAFFVCRAIELRA